MYTARPPGRPRCLLPPPADMEGSRDAGTPMTLAGAPLQGYSTGDPAPAGPSSEWAAPQQGSPGRRRCFRIDFPGTRSSLALPAKLNQRRLTISVPHGPKRQP
ncbi:hypothetical protein NDU88_005480 [Pleurodeles waltl]|uniref:Uncharacterized protein n=1 Tax=Pleurodeles waltl TaxID=8319 RepID=A0AAV7PIN1_PLEWA|nr:hypothetical protein NDU88_005480 [Pleurodeles waltl]